MISRGKYLLLDKIKLLGIWSFSINGFKNVDPLKTKIENTPLYNIPIYICMCVYSILLWSTYLINLDTLELIKISKDDFEDVIKDNLRLQWISNSIAIKKLPHFDYLSTEDINRCSTFSFIKTFQKNEYVLRK